MAIFTKKTHRGVDINPLGSTAESGTEYPSTPVVGQIFYRTDLSTMSIYDGKGWSGLASSVSPPSTPTPAPIESISSWAADKLLYDNDIVYIRRKNDRLFWADGNKMGGTTWREINGTGVLPTGLKQEIIESGEVTAPAEEVILTHIPSGWYQDTSANLFKHEGGGIWMDASNTMAKKLTKSAEAGEMEYLG